MKISRINSFFNKKPVEFVYNQDLVLNLIKEDNAFVPRFNLKDLEIFKNIPVNKPIKYNQDILIKAIKYGMIFLINYKGAKDGHYAGHERVIYPMVIGRSKTGKVLLRGYHLNGWSVSQNKNIKKTWRMFRPDRILSMTFTGSFYRLAPDGYNINDKGMRGGIIARADFNQIRKNQQTLLNQQKIKPKEEETVTKGESNFGVIEVSPTGSVLDLNDPMDNAYINQIKDLNKIKISFLKSIYGNKYIAILGAIGKPGNNVKVIDGKKNLGTYRVLDSISGDILKKMKRFRGNNLYDLYFFEKKV